MITTSLLPESADISLNFLFDLSAPVACFTPSFLLWPPTLSLSVYQIQVSGGLFNTSRSCFTVKEGPSRPFYLVLEIWWFHQPEEEFRFSKFRRILHCGSVQDSHTDSITANLKTTATTTKNPKTKLIYLNSIYIEYFLHHDYRMVVYPGNLSITDRNIWFLFSFFFFFLF